MSNQQEPTVKVQVMQTLAESYNLLMQAKFDGVSGEQFSALADLQSRFQAIIVAINDGSIDIVEVATDEEGDNETA